MHAGQQKYATIAYRSERKKGTTSMSLQELQQLPDPLPQTEPDVAQPLPQTEPIPASPAESPQSPIPEEVPEPTPDALPQMEPDVAQPLPDTTSTPTTMPPVEPV